MANMFKNLFYSGKKKSRSKIDFINIVESINGAKDLHKKLIVECHPDKFMTLDKKILAENISKLVNENRYNLAELKKIEEQIITDLKDC